MNVTRSEMSGCVTTNNGIASFTGVQIPTPDQRALVPGAADAYAAFEAQNSAAQPLHAEAKRLSRELYDLRRSKHPALVYDQAREDELVLRRAQLDSELKRNAQVAKNRALDFLLLVFNTPRSGETVRQAAKLALEAHQTAADALETLEAALSRRDALYVSAGSPSAHEFHRHTLGYAHRDGRLGQAHYLVAQQIAGFPVEAIEIVADGGEVATADQLLSEAREAAKTTLDRTHNEGN